MNPRVAVADSLPQLVALLSQSRLSLRNWLCFTAVHQTIGNNSRSVTDEGTDSIHGLLQDQGVSVVNPDQELEAQVYWRYS